MFSKLMAVMNERHTRISFWAMSVLVLGAATFLTFSLLTETGDLIFLAKRKGLGILLACALALLLTFLGNVAPLLSVLAFVLDFRLGLRESGKARSVKTALARGFGGDAGWMLFATALFLPFWFLMDSLFPISVTPLVTTGCAILGVVFGDLICRRYLKLRPRLVLVSLGLFVILGAKYVDWNSRKPLVRDMYRLRTGMTARQADQIMLTHKVGPTGGYPHEESPDKDGILVYGTPRSVDQVTLEIRDGRVAHIEFEHD